MYKVIKINESSATRIIELQNEKTGTKELCFDDSALVSYQNFEFMKEGEIYDCKIELFGIIVQEKTVNSIKCEIINENVMIGKKVMMQVLIDSDIYYIIKSQLKSDTDKSNLFYEFTRKNLIQVNNDIHRDFL